MRSNQSSTTAEFMALFRAQESALPESKRLFNDPFAVSFLGPILRVISRLFRVPLLRILLTLFIDARWPGARTSGIARTRLIDDWAGAEVAAGAQQILILGAGSIAERGAYLRSAACPSLRLITPRPPL